MRVCYDDDGIISNLIKADPQPGDIRVGVLLPSPSNLHSHAFQRAMAGLTEGRGDNERDSFWTWRKLMYQFLQHLTPDDIEAITAFAQMQMLEAGFASVAEFHYLHHQPNGSSYGNIAELSDRIISAANDTGIGLTLLPVLYERGGCDDRALIDSQLRFGNDLDRFFKLHNAAAKSVKSLPSDCILGISAHSLRAVTTDSLKHLVGSADTQPLHIHIAEQLAEIEEVLANYGARPVEWLLSNHNVTPNWCLVHATHMTPQETKALASSGAVAGICPLTEANLGDGIFEGVDYFAHAGRFGIGTDSNIRISLKDELQMLEYSQRLKEKSRAVLATKEVSTGHTLLSGAAKGGAQALGRNNGAIRAGSLADFIALNDQAIDLANAKSDQLIDGFIFAGNDTQITDVWSAGRHLVKDGHHIAREKITTRYASTLKALLQRL